ncbi:MAG: hypothetical protein MJK18_12575 [Bdellovibrionales bacterium]|nr:hypothetical protein [Bdellovibrionales bacterium]
MNKNDWEDILKEPVSEELKHKTLARARQELDSVSTHSFDWRWLAALVPGLAALLIFIRKRTDENTDIETSLAQEDNEFIDEIKDFSAEELAELEDDLLEDLEFYEDLDILEDWDGSEES